MDNKNFKIFGKNKNKNKEAKIEESPQAFGGPDKTESVQDANFTVSDDLLETKADNSFGGVVFHDESVENLVVKEGPLDIKPDVSFGNDADVPQEKSAESIVDEEDQLEIKPDLSFVDDADVPQEKSVESVADEEASLGIKEVDSSEVNNPVSQNTPDVNFVVGSNSSSTDNHGIFSADEDVAQDASVEKDASSEDVEFFTEDSDEDAEGDLEVLDEILEGTLVSMSEKTGAKNIGDEDAGTSLSVMGGSELQETDDPLVGEGGIGKGRMGERMVAMGLITEDQLNVALQEKKISGKMLGEILVELGFIEEDTLTLFLAESSGFGVFDPRNTIVDAEALAILNKTIAQQHQILPISFSAEAIYVAMSDPYDVVALDTLKRFLPNKNLQIKPMVTTSSILSDAIDASYGYASSIKAILDELEEGKDQKEVASLKENEAFSHPIVRLVNALVFDAVKIGASDLHFEPEDNFVRLRYRLDGVLFTAQILHKQHWNGISQRIKIMSEMNIADKFSPQDGRFNLNIGGREADFRVSSLPTVHGENIVLRVLDKSESIMPMENLGFSPENIEKLKLATSKPEGIIIVTGPTGSGKSTSLYSILNEINDVEVNIQTLEDPVEYSLPMIRQTHVREGVLEFADGIKALLRQDPDIIFIGEIRDQITAEMALKAAMTGHQVFTSLHTNDSFGAIPRLLDLGMKPGMLSGAIVAVFAQRLARRLCVQCKEDYTPNEEECGLMGVDPAEPPSVYKHKDGGCSLCNNTGYKGRVALVEILLFDEDLDESLAKNESKAEIKAIALKKGFKSLKDDGILKVLDGVTDLPAIGKIVDLRK